MKTNIERYIPEVGAGNKSYATDENAVKAVEKFIGARPNLGHQHYVIMTGSDGRYVPVFIGERAITAGIHFHFHVVG